MAVRALIVSVLLAVAAALVPMMLGDDTVHTAEGWSAPEPVAGLAQTPAEAAASEAAENAAFASAPVASAPVASVAGDRDVLAVQTVEEAPVEIDEASRGRRTEAVAALATTPQPEAAADAAVTEAPAETTTVPAAAPLPQAPVPANAEAATDTAPDAPAVATELFAPAPVAGYTIGDLAARPANGNPDTNPTTGAVAMLPEGVDVDPNSDMVEILVSSGGQGALFPAELGPVDFSRDMVAIVLG